MPILEELNDEQIDKQWKDALVLRVAKQINQLNAVMVSTNQEFWSKLPTPRLLALLNADVMKSLQMLMGNSELGTVTNKWLDALGQPQLLHRVPLSMGLAGISFNGVEFIYAAPVEPEPEPVPVELEPEPDPVEPEPEP